MWVPVAPDYSWEAVNRKRYVPHAHNVPVQGNLLQQQCQGAEVVRTEGEGSHWSFRVLVQSQKEWNVRKGEKGKSQKGEKDK